MRAAAEPDMTAVKTAMRKWIGDMRREFAAEWVTSASRRIAERVVALPEFEAADRVGCYLSVLGEVQTDGIIAHCRAAGKTVAVPASPGRGQPYGFVVLEPEAPLAAGQLGIPQPVGGQPVRAAELEFIVVPGVAFDAAGGRLGHGGGHYDRMLADAGESFKAAVGFGFQLVDRVPMGARDVRMNAVITDTAVIRLPR